MYQIFEDSFFVKIVNEGRGATSRLMHGASLQVYTHETAHPWRNAAFVVAYGTDLNKKDERHERLLEGGYEVQGYLN